MNKQAVLQPAPARLDEPLIKSPAVRWAVMLGVWTLITLFFVGQGVTARLVDRRTIDWPRVIGLEFVYWYVWAILAPAAMWLARRYRLSAIGSKTNTDLTPRRGSRFMPLGAGIALHSAFGLLLSAAHALGTFFLNRAFYGPMRWGDSEVTFEMFARVRLPVELFTGFYKYWLIVIIWWALDYHRKYREREVQTAQLETKLTQAQLHALKMQLHPHFLFNTLHAVSMLNFTDVDAANRMLVQLSDLLRLTLENSGAQEVRLRQELDFLRRYLEIEQTRFQDRLSVDIDADPKLLDAQIPNLILQPLVENAIRHGVGKQARAARVRIAARRQGNDLQLEVSDDGPGLPAGWNLERDGGIGLSNTVARLRQLYGDRHRFEIVPGDMGGLNVRITLPLRFSPRDQNAA
jgi:two-component system LytT family sensor kinase